MNARDQQVTYLHELNDVPNGAVLRDALGQIWTKRANAKYESTSGLTCLSPTLLPATIITTDQAPAMTGASDFKEGQ